MGVAVHVCPNAPPNACHRKVLRTNPKGAKAECIFADGTSILVSNFLASFIRAGDELLFSVDLEAADSSTEIYIRKTYPGVKRRDLFQTRIGYASQPRKDKRNNLFISSEVLNPRLAISAIYLPTEALRDYFYVGNRHRAWDRQPSLYELLRVNRNASLAELRLAFKLRTLELRTVQASHSNVAALERVFNILAHPELRACYNALQDDPASPALFPYGGFGSLLAAGDISRDGSTFYVSRILSFLPEQKIKHLRAPLRRITFYNDHAIYRDSRRKLEVLFDPTSLPLLWDSSWNQWKHLLGAKIAVKATFVQSGKYQHRSNAWHPVQWETALPSRIEVELPSNIAEQIDEARKTHHRFGEFAGALDLIRARIDSAPVGRADLQKLCAGLRMPGDFDVAQITWRSDYDPFFYRHLCRRARTFYLFREQYIFDLERGVVIETAELGHATYVFAKPESMAAFLADYVGITKEDILTNRSNVAERLGYLGRVVHGANPRGWLKKIKAHLGETPDFAQL